MAADLPVRVVVADRPCRALEVAAAASVPEVLVDRADFGGFGAAFDREAYTGAITDALVSPRRSTWWSWPASAPSWARPSTTPSPVGSSTPTPPCCPPSPAGTRWPTPWPPAWTRPGPPSTSPPWRWTPGPVLAQAGGAGAARRHRGHAARAHQVGGAHALPRHHPPLHRRVGGDGGGWVRITNGGCDHEGTAVRLRQDRVGRAGPRALGPGLGADLQRRHLGGPGRGRHRPHRGGRAHRRPRDARRPGQDPPPDDPRRHPGRPVEARAPGRGRAARASVSSTWWSATSTRSPPTRRSSSSTSAGRPWCGPRRRTTTTSGSWSRPADYPAGPGRAAASTARSPTPPGAGWPGTPSPTPPATTPPSSSGSTSAAAAPAEADGDGPADVFETAALLPPSHPPDPRAGRLAALRREPAPARGPLPRSPASTRGGTTWSSTAARSSPTSTSSTPMRRGGWSTSSSPTGGTDQAVAIIKHANPCGAALHPDLVVAYERALECDPQSAFGGIVAIGGPVTAAGGRGHRGRSPGRRDHRPLLRRGGPGPAGLQAQGHPAAVGARPRAGGPPDPGPRGQRAGPGRRPVPGRALRLGGGHQGGSRPRPSGGTWPWPGRSAPAPPPTPSPWSPTARPSGWGPASSRGWWRPRSPWPRPGPGRPGGAAASDAFFPFPDGLLVLADAGVAAVVQPGGSIRDAEVIAAADEAGIAMVMAGGERHFRH